MGYSPNFDTFCHTINRFLCGQSRVVSLRVDKVKPDGGQARKLQKEIIFFLQKWPIPMLVQNISRGNKILKTF